MCVCNYYRPYREFKTNVTAKATKQPAGELGRYTLTGVQVRSWDHSKISSRALVVTSHASGFLVHVNMLL